MRAQHPEIGDRNYAKVPLTTEEVRAIVVAAGGVPTVMNARHETAQAHGWKENPPDVETFVAAAVAECNLLRRPILLVGGAALVGNQADAMLKALG